MRAHEPVLLAEVLELLAVKPGGLYVDGTVGLGGHAEELLRRSSPDGRLLALDRDSETLASTTERLSSFGERARFVHADYREIPALLREERADGILLDLGISSAQLDDPERGFSFQADGPLDMRMDRSHGETAADVVNRLGEPDLADLIYRYGEEPGSRRIAKAIATARRKGRHPHHGRARGHRAPGGAPPQARPPSRDPDLPGDPHPREPRARGPPRHPGRPRPCLAPGGRLAVIAFHSLEDREVKEAFRGLEPEGFRRLTRKPLRPTDDEVRRNPRSRSARLRGLLREAA